MKSYVAKAVLKIMLLAFLTKDWKYTKAFTRGLLLVAK